MEQLSLEKSGKLKLKKKALVLKKKGDSGVVELGSTTVVTMKWFDPIDLDLHVFAQSKKNAVKEELVSPTTSKKVWGATNAIVFSAGIVMGLVAVLAFANPVVNLIGVVVGIVIAFFGAVIKMDTVISGGYSSRSSSRSDNVHVYYGNKGRSNIFPYIQLDHDAGVGNTVDSASTGNEENVHIHKLSEYDFIVLATDIYGYRGKPFSDYDANVIVRGLNEEYVVELDSEEKGKWAIFALIDNTGERPELVKINQVQNNKPTVSQVRGLVNR